MSMSVVPAQAGTQFPAAADSTLTADVRPCAQGSL
jgi:hypothetical protein